ncbi:MAG: hypothetical protein M3388_05675 [Acidobacteriota bacterium]|nr:hypothetical protein [Acidobacteriota bacterium]
MNAKIRITERRHLAGNERVSVQIRLITCGLLRRSRGMCRQDAGVPVAAKVL